MNSRIAMSEEKRTRLAFIGIAALCVAGVLKFLTPFVPQSISVSLTLNLLMAAAGLLGIISFWAIRPMSVKLGVTRAIQRRELGTTLVFGAIYFAFATLLFWSVYSSSAQIKFAGDVALWFFLAFQQWDTWRGSRHPAEPA